MPQIKEYTNRSEVAGAVSGRRVSGEDFGAVGSALRQAGGEVQNFGQVIHKRVEQQEVADASVEMSEVHSEFTTKYNDDLQKGTLNHEEFKQKYDDRMSELRGKYGTRAGKDFFSKSNASMRAHFMEATFAGQAELAGVKTREDYTKSQNNFTSSLMGDPSSLPLVSKVNEKYIDSLVATGSLPAVVAEKLKTQAKGELTKSAIRGWIDLNPEETQKRLNSGEWDDAFDGDVKKQLLGEADQEIRGRRTDAERIKQENEKYKVEQQKQTQAKFLEKMTTGQLSMREILKSNLEPFGSGSKEQFLRLAEMDVKKESKTDPALMNELTRRAFLPEGDPKKLTEAEVYEKASRGGLQLPAVKQLVSAVQGSFTTEGKQNAALRRNLMKQAEGKLVKKNPMMGIADPDGEQRLATFQMDIEDQIQKGKARGLSERDMLDPNNPEYVGRYIGNYVKTGSELMQAQMKSMQPQAPVAAPDGTIPGKAGVQKRLPGETPDAYLKRIGG